MKFYRGNEVTDEFLADLVEGYKDGVALSGESAEGSDEEILAFLAGAGAATVQQATELGQASGEKKQKDKAAEEAKAKGEAAVAARTAYDEKQAAKNAPETPAAPAQ